MRSQYGHRKGIDRDHSFSHRFTHEAIILRYMKSVCSRPASPGNITTDRVHLDSHFAVASLRAIQWGLVLWTEVTKKLSAREARAMFLGVPNLQLDPVNGPKALRFKAPMGDMGPQRTST